MSLTYWKHFNINNTGLLSQRWGFFSSFGYSRVGIKYPHIIVQANSGILLESWELLSGKGLGVEKPLLGSQEAPQQNPCKSDLKKMCYSTWKFDTHIAHLKYSYLGYLLELEAPGGVQNDRNSHIMVGEW